MRNLGPSIRDVLLCAYDLMLHEDDAVRYVRHAIVVNKVSDERLREYYRDIIKEKAKKKENQKC